MASSMASCYRIRPRFLFPDAALVHPRFAVVMNVGYTSPKRGLDLLKKFALVYVDEDLWKSRLPLWRCMMVLA